MADWDLPVISTIYTSVLDYLKARDEDAITLCFSAPSNTPEHAIKWNRADDVFEEWEAGAWNDLIIALAGGGTGASTAAGARTNLGLGSISTQASSSVAITGGTISGVAITSSTAILTGGSIAGMSSISATNLAGAGAGITALNASNLASGTVAPARLGSGTPDNTTYLRGDSTWATIVINPTRWTSLYKSGAYTVTVADINDKTAIFCTGTFSLELPAANDAGIDNPCNGLMIYNIGTGVITIDPTGANTILGAATFDLPIQYMSVMAMPDITNNDWVLI